MLLCAGCVGRPHTVMICSVGSTAVNCNAILMLKVIVIRTHKAQYIDVP